MSANDFRNAVIKVIERNGTTTFAVLDRLRGAAGEVSLLWDANPSVTLWVMSQDLADAVGELRRAGIVAYGLSSVSEYAAAGAKLRMPVADLEHIARGRRHKTEHWLPVSIVPGPNWSARAGAKPAVTRARPAALAL